MGEIKLIDTLKFYQKIIADLASALSNEEKIAVKKLTERFLNEYYYFCTIWPYLNSTKWRKKIDIISEGKGVIPYELVIDMESFFITPENVFWGKTEFFCELKQSVINNDDYENSK